MKNISSNKVLLGIWGAFVALTVCSCGEKEFYTDEEYRKECYIVSGDNNVFGQEYTFGNDSTGYISIYASGTTPVDHDVTVTLRENRQYLINYNKSIYGNTYKSYSELLPENRYSLPDGWQAVIRPDNAYTLFPIKVDIDSLSPDLDYFLPIEIAQVSDYQYNADKNYVLFHILMKNEFATTKSTTYYQMVGTTLDIKNDNGWINASEKGSPTVFNATKKVVPIARDAVRMLPGTMQNTQTAFVNSNSIRVTVLDDQINVPVLGDDGLPTGKTVVCRKVTIRPYLEGDKNIQVMEASDEIDPTQGNKLESYYNSEEKTFTLNYCYRLATDGKGMWHKVKEVMTLLNN